MSMKMYGLKIFFFIGRCKSRKVRNKWYILYIGFKFVRKLSSIYVDFRDYLV